jgi:type VI secretion system protein ImpH
LNRAAFESLLPGTPQLRAFIGLVRAFLGFETAFAINLVLHREAVPPLCLGTTPTPRLGWNTWLTAPAASRLADPDEPLFEASIVEAQAA